MWPRSVTVVNLRLRVTEYAAQKQLSQDFIMKQVKANLLSEKGIKSFFLVP